MLQNKDQKLNQNTTADENMMTCLNSLAINVYCLMGDLMLSGTTHSCDMLENNLETCNEDLHLEPHSVPVLPF